MTDEQKKEEKQKKDQWLNDIRHVLSTAQGRRFYYTTMARCKTFKDEYSSDANLVYFLKGQRSIGLRMFDDLLAVDQKLYIQMIQENESQEMRKEIKQERVLKEKLSDPFKIDSPSLPNTGPEKSTGGK